MSHFSKTASPWCFWFLSTVTECRSRWIIPSIQTAAIVILKEQTYVGEWNVDHFKGMMKAQCWIVEKEAPMNGWKRGIKGGRGERKRFQTNPTSSSVLFDLISNFIFSLCLLCQQFWFQCVFPPKQFWESSQRDKGIWLLLLLLLGLLQYLLIVYVCLEHRWFLWTLWMTCSWKGTICL